MSSYPVRHSPDTEFRFFVFDPNDSEFTYYRTPEDRDKGADQVIQSYLDDGWDEMVQQVVAGEMTHFCGQVGREDRPADSELDAEGNDKEGNHWGEFKYRCDYDLLPLESVAEGEGVPA